MSDQAEIRLAYHAPGRAVRIDELRCAPGDMPDVILRIVAAWNAAIPKNRVRVVNQPRYLDILTAMRVFAPDEICKAIWWYGKQPWQRQRGAWMTFDSFIAEDRLTQWVESAMEHEEKAEAAEAARTAAGQAAQIAAAQPTEAQKAEQLRRQQAEAFDALPGSEKYRLLDEARRVLPHSLRTNAGQVRIRAIAIMGAGGKESTDERRRELEKPVRRTS